MQALTEEDYKRAAASLCCSVAAIKAVAEVEAPGSGFLPDGRPKILFERHIFRRQLIQQQVNTAVIEEEFPGLCNRKPGGYEGGEYEHIRLDRAVRIHRDAALKSCSWGRFQIMGFNWRATGAKSLQDFVNAMYRSEAAQLEAFTNFLFAEGLDDEMAALKWAEFAERYNGPAYRKNRYDTKLAAAYKKFSQEGA
jgi:hypothetical protein